MSKQENLTVIVSHDKIENVWHVLSSDVPGLHAEAETLDDLVAVIADLAPQLIAANLPGTDEGALDSCGPRALPASQSVR